MPPRDGQLSKSQLQWCRIHLLAFAKLEQMASAAEADTAAYRARYQEQLEKQSAELAEKNGTASHCSKAVLALATALAAQGDGWQSIESAPRDCCILVAGGTVHARDDSFSPYEGPCTTASIVYWYQDHWRGDNLEGHDNWFEHRPTHWMPLPSAPSHTSPERTDK